MQWLVIIIFIISFWISRTKFKRIRSTQAMQAAMRSIFYYGLFAGLIVIPLIWFEQGMPSNRTMLFWLMLMIVSAYSASHHRPGRKQEIRFHNMEGSSFCGCCQYNLTGNISGRCPECGWEIPSEQERDQVAAGDWYLWWMKWEIGRVDKPKQKLWLMVSLFVVVVAWLCLPLFGFESSPVYPVMMNPGFILVGVLLCLFFGLNALRLGIYIHNRNYSN